MYASKTLTILCQLYFVAPDMLQGKQGKSNHKSLPFTCVAVKDEFVDDRTYHLGNNALPNLRLFLQVSCIQCNC